MSILTNTVSTLARSCARTSTASVARSAGAATAVQSRNSSSSNTTSFDSPFRGFGNAKASASAVPDFSKYRSSNSESSNRTFQYFMVGTFGAVTAMGAKNTVTGE